MMPAGELVTVPPPPLVTVRACCGGPNAAVTDWFDPIVIEHAPVPVQAPLQPLKTNPEPGAAARLTTVPDAYVAEHVPVVQEIPDGELVTVPVAPPESETVVESVY